MNQYKIDEFLWQEIEKENASPVPDFEGISPNEMCIIRNNPFDKNSPLSLLELSNNDLNEIWLLQIALMIAKATDNPKGLNLTAKGFIPVSLVKEIKEAGLVHEEMIESGLYKLYKESDSEWITLAHILLKISGILKNRHNVLSLTATGKFCLKDHNLMLRKLLESFMIKFNWGYFDGYNSPYIGKLNCAFSLILLNKYGKEKYPEYFYSEKYIKASRMLLAEITDLPYNSFSEESYNCYASRTFHRFLEVFNFVDIERKGIFSFDCKVVARPVFYKLIKVKK